MPSSRGRNSSGRGMGEATSESNVQRGLVDINIATVEELSTLVGVGRSRAEAIVETRNVSLSFILPLCYFSKHFPTFVTTSVTGRIYFHRRPEPSPRGRRKFDRS